MSLELGTPYVEGAGRVIIPIQNRNLGRGRSQGAELLVEWQPLEFWRLSLSHSAIDLELDSTGLDLNNHVWLDGATPRGMTGLRSLLTFGEFEVDAHFRHHTRLRRLPVDPSGEGIDAYTSLDLRLAWHVAPEWRIALVGQNLLDDEHVEFGTPNTRGDLERAAYLKAEWRHE